MQSVFADDIHANAPTKKIKVNWANECVAGALLSAAFTIMAAHAGTQGVTGDSFAAFLHQFIIIGGISMSAVCGVAGLAITLFQLLQDLVRKTLRALQTVPVRQRPFGSLQAVKFIKIFLP